MINKLVFLIHYQFLPIPTDGYLKNFDCEHRERLIHLCFDIDMANYTFGGGCFFFTIEAAGQARLDFFVGNGLDFAAADQDVHIFLILIIA
jgi:hypothetical protein